jgi:integrase
MSAVEIIRPKRTKKPATKHKLSELYLRSLLHKTHAEKFLVWDTECKGLALSVQPTGHAAYKVIYSRGGRPRWFHIGNAASIGLADARTLARRILFQVAEGKDPQGERAAQRGEGKFADLHGRYLKEYAQKQNKSWQEADYLVRRHLLPLWGNIPARNITRTDVKALMGRLSETPILANKVLAMASAVFTWGIKQEIVTVNPCRNVDRNKTTSRERVLSDSELPRFWSACGKYGIPGLALKLILILGQRPGEVLHMRFEHVVDGWWMLPGEVIADTWPGTKNGCSHRVWLPKPAQDILSELKAAAGFVLTGSRGRAVARLDRTMSAICTELGIEKVTPHDLRRTHGTTITRLGFGREAMHRIENHREGGIGDVYDQHCYAKENQTIMETVAAHLLNIISGDNETNVIALRKA